jgi:hypothetical protein
MMTAEQISAFGGALERCDDMHGRKPALAPLIAEPLLKV